MGNHAFGRFITALFIAALGVGCTAACAADDIVLVPERVSPHGWFFQGQAGMASAANRGFMSNAGFVVTDDGVVVFDALGTPVLGRAMIDAIRKITRAPIKRVIVSHYHADHVYGLEPLKEAGAEIWAYRKGEAYFTSGIAQDRLLYAGDLIFSGRIPYVGNGDSKGWLQATNRMLALAPAVVVPGHGPVSRDVASDLALTHDYLVYLRASMGRAVQQLTPFDEAYAQTDWSRYRALPAFEPANRINAWGTYLRMEQEELQSAR